MGRYIFRRLLQAIPLLFIISVILFALVQNIGDPVAMMGGRTATRSADRERLRRQLGLDQPIYVQYFYWLVGNDWAKVDLDGDGVPETPGQRKGVLRGDFGTSIVKRGTPVMELIWERIPNTLILMIPAQIIILIFGISIGIIAALRQYSVLDVVVTAFSFVGLSMPIFFIALSGIYIFAVLFKGWGLPFLPANGMFDPQVGKTTPQVIWHLILPASSIAFLSIASYNRYTRSSMLEVINQDYMRTAKAKGLTGSYLLVTHAFKDASFSTTFSVPMDPW